MILCRRQWGWFVILGSIWLPVLWRISEVWRHDPEMGHGWLVPILVGYLGWERSELSGNGQNGSPGLAWLAGVGLGGTALGLWVLVANPLWPTLMWFTVFMAGMATLGVIGALQGPGALRRWWPMVALMLLALPWPTMIQQPVTLGLAQLNAQVAAEIVSAQGYPATVHGRVIEVGAGVAGVEDACSGIRSLQSVTMAAVFLAALFHLSWRQGIGLVLAGWVVAVVGNLIRTCVLVNVLAREGTERMNAVHDAAGNWVLMVTLGILAVAAWGLPVNTTAMEPGARVRSTPRSPRLRRWVGVTLGWAILTQTGLAWWYSLEGQGRVRQGLTWNALAGGQPETIPRHAQEMLAYTAGAGRSWVSRGDQPAQLAFLFHWEGDVKFLGSAALHDPTICLPGIGSRLERELEAVTVGWPDGEIEFAAYRFVTARGRTQFVFFQVWDAFRGQEWQPQPGFHRDLRWSRVTDRQLSADIYQVLMVVEREWSDDEAREFAQIRLPEIFAMGRGPR